MLTCDKGTIRKATRTYLDGGDCRARHWIKRLRPAQEGVRPVRYAPVEDPDSPDRPEGCLAASPSRSAAGRQASLGNHGPDRTAAPIHYVIGDSASTLHATLRVRPHHTRAPLGLGTDRVLGWTEAGPRRSDISERKFADDPAAQVGFDHVF